MNLAETFLDLLYPPKCTFCGALLAHPRDMLCPACRGQLPWQTGPQAERRVEFITLCVSPLWYQDQVRKAVHRFKFEGCWWYARTFGPLMAQCVREHLAGQYDVLTWAPVSRKRRWERGYDQGQLLAQELGSLLDLEAVSALRKVRHTPAQSGLEEASARRANVLGVYQIAAPELVQGRRVLLVDDVVTTGSTLSECARTLLEAGAQSVSAVTLARARA